VNVKKSSNEAFKEFVKVKKHSRAAFKAIQIWVITKYFLRLKISANAPLGIPNRKTGKFDAVWINATKVGELDNEVIIQEAATSFIHIQILDAIQANQSIKKTWFFNGIHQRSCLVTLVEG
jgi:hypothetical protein